MLVPEMNEAQLRAATDGDGASLVLAGAGSGKTRVIVERLAWLIGEQGVDPRHILALTFTNKAAEEMRQRVAVRLGRERIGAWLGTFHSFGLFILRREIEHLGRPKVFTVLDDSDQMSLVKQLIRALDAKWTAVSPRDALAWISLQKQEFRTPQPEDAATLEEMTFLHLWHGYHEALFRASAVDFDDLLVLPVRLFQEHAEVRERYQRRYQYVHIDEYQDTNRVQYLLARQLSESHGNLFVVGDEDQSIYGWRGATIRNILDFEKDFPSAKVFRLEQNYRSTAPILSAANAVVSHNEQRLGKTLWTAQKGGEPVQFYEAADSEEEAHFVAEAIGKLGVERGRTAVLYRTNSQARAIEEAFRLKSIAYVVVGGVKFYARKEIKDILAYLRLLVNPADNVSMRRIINVPTRGIGASTQERLEEYAAARNCPLLAVLREIESDQTFAPRARQSAAELVHLLDDLALEAKREEGLANLVKHLLDKTGYIEFMRRGEEDFRSRKELVDEFISACARRDAGGEMGLESFLQDLALMTDVDDWDPDTPAVTLMTCHSAKGLEFAHVFLIGLEEGLLPHASSLHSDEEVEEERRLCYVAMTRARQTLTLTAARERMLYGENSRRELSRFIREIPRTQLGLAGRDKEPAHKAATPKPGAKAAEPGAFHIGMRVRHAKFGEGVVMFTAGSGDKLKARVRFKTGRSRDFMVKAAPLEVLEDA